MFRPIAQTQSIDWEALSRYLARRGLGIDLARAPRQFTGGLGNWNYLVEVDGQPFVLRRPPSGPLPVGANDMAREHRILSRLNRSFPLAPLSPVFCEDPSVIGAPFLLIEYREGRVVRSELPVGLADTATQRLELASRAVNVLVQLHSLEPEKVGLHDLGRPTGMAARQARNWALRAHEAFGSGMSQTLHAISEWLSRPAPLPQRASILHSDFKFDNLIISQTTAEPVALIDWDMGTLGDPLLDVATLLSYWVEPGDPPPMQALRQMPTALPGFPTRAQVLELYARRSGLDVSQFKYYRMLALFKLCVVFQQLYRRYLRGDSNDERAAPFGPLTAGLIDFTANALATERY